MSFGVLGFTARPAFVDAVLATFDKRFMDKLEWDLLNTGRRVQVDIKCSGKFDKSTENFTFTLLFYEENDEDDEDSIVTIETETHERNLMVSLEYPSDLVLTLECYDMHTPDEHTDACIFHLGLASGWGSATQDEIKDFLEKLFMELTTSILKNRVPCRDLTFRSALIKRSYVDKTGNSVQIQD